MNRVRLTTIMLPVVLGLAVTAFAQDTPKDPPKDAPKIDVTGTWDLAVETPQGTMSLVATFKQDAEKLTGTQVSQMGELPLEGTVKGADIAFAVVFDMQGQQMTITYTGKIDGDQISGSIEFGSYGASTWSAQKRKQ